MVHPVVARAALRFAVGHAVRRATEIERGALRVEAGPVEFTDELPPRADELGDLPL